MSGPGQRFWSFVLGRPSTPPTGDDRFVRLDVETGDTHTSTWSEMIAELDEHFAEGIMSGFTFIQNEEDGAPAGQHPQTWHAPDTGLSYVWIDGTGWVQFATAEGVIGSDGLGWTGGSYDPATGIVTFTSDDGLGFQTGDLRGTGSGGAGFVAQTDPPADTTVLWIDTDDNTVDPGGGSTDAADINIVDTAGYYTATNVEAALAEVKLVADTAVTPGEAAAAYQPLAAVLTNTTASFTTADESKLDGIEAAADVTDTANVTAAGALMDSEVTNLAAVKAFDPTNYATAAQGTTADAALPRVAGGASVENVGAIESNVQTVAATGATETLDTSVYGVFDMTMDEACTFTFSNPAPSGKATIFTLILRGSFTPTFPASVDWPDGTEPTYSTPTVYTFFSVDAGTTWLGASAGKAFA